MFLWRPLIDCRWASRRPLPCGARQGGVRPLLPPPLSGSWEYLPNRGNIYQTVGTFTKPWEYMLYRGDLCSTGDYIPWENMLYSGNISWEYMVYRGNICCIVGLYAVGKYVVLREYMFDPGNICLTVGIYVVPWDYLDGWRRGWDRGGCRRRYVPHRGKHLHQVARVYIVP